MDRRRVVLADVFATEPLSGSRVAVLGEAAGLSEAQFLAIADELAGDRTAFLSTAAEDLLRVFDEQGPVERVGAAGIAAVATRVEAGAVEAGRYEVRFGDGRAEFDVGDSGHVRLGYSKRSVRPVPAAESTLADALGIDKAAIVTDELPVAVASVDRPVLIVPLDYLSTVGAVSPAAEPLEAVLQTHDADAVVPFTFDTLDRESSLHARLFQPGGRTLESNVPPDASGALGAYLQHTDAFDAFPEDLLVEQGHYLDRPGRARVRVEADVWVGGPVTTSLEGELTIPAADDEDDIIEA